jgi:hypothetical protein
VHEKNGARNATGPVGIQLAGRARQAAAGAPSGSPAAWCRRRRGRRRCPVLRRARRLAGHDVVDLLASMVSHSSSALAIACILSWFSSMSLRAMAYCSSMMRRISRSTLLHRLLGHVGGLGDGAAEEDLALVLGVDHRAELVGHAVAHHHVAGDRVARSKSLLAPVVIWFMNTSSAMRPPKSTRDGAQHALLVHAVAVALGQLHRHAQRAAARDDR